MKRIMLASLALIVSSITICATDSTNVTYPSHYKEWKHIKTLIIKPEHPMGNIFHGIHHIYANDKAYAGYTTGTFEDGSVIALDYLHYADANDTISETDRIYVAIMEKDSKKYASSQGWGYEAFKGKTQERLVTNVAIMCANCHQSQSKRDYIFSHIRK